MSWLSRFFRRTRDRSEKPSDVTLQELRERAERVSRAAGLSGSEEAFRRLDAGELDGTLLETELRMVRHLQEAPRERELTTT